MTRDETRKILAVLRTAYPNFYRNVSDKEATDTVNLWASMFADDNPNLVAAAVKSIIVASNREFPPNIGTIKEQMRKLMEDDDLSEMEAWAKISAACRNGIYGAQEEFDKMSPTLQRIVGSPQQLSEWALLDAETLQSVVASNIQRSFRTVQQREREQAKLPHEVQNLLQSIRIGNVGTLKGENDVKRISERHVI